jgi:hypothetical protein
LDVELAEGGIDEEAVLDQYLVANAMSEDAMNLYIGIESEALLIPSTRKVSAPRLPATRHSKLVSYLLLLYKYLYKYHTRIQGWTLFPTLMLVVNSRK